jgi:hypothetical protein
MGISWQQAALLAVSMCALDLEYPALARKEMYQHVPRGQSPFRDAKPDNANDGGVETD